MYVTRLFVTIQPSVRSIKLLQSRRPRQVFTYMTEQETVRKVKRIFVASPGDLAKERKRFPKILERINRLKAHPIGVDLEARGWEDTPPGMGRPQALINQDVEKCDLFVMLLWKRWGTPPGGDSQYTSGTQEEFELASKIERAHV